MYRLNGDAILLADLHDCAAILERISSDTGDRLLDLDAERGNYLVVGTTSCRIDPGVEAVLELFEEPRLCRDVIRAVAEATGASGIEPFFEELARAGIIVRESARLAQV